MTTTKIIPPRDIHHRGTKAPAAKPDSGSDEVHTAPLINDMIPINRKHRARQIPDDADEESNAIRAIMSQSKPSPPERYSSNNSAIRLQQQQQQGIGDHLHSKQHKIRNKISSKSHGDYEEHEPNHGRLLMYLLMIVLLVFVIYRFLLASWPKPRKTWFEEILDDLNSFFTL